MMTSGRPFPPFSPLPLASSPSSAHARLQARKLGRCEREDETLSRDALPDGRAPRNDGRSRKAEMWTGIGEL